MADTFSVSTFNALAQQCANTLEFGFPHVDPAILTWEHRGGLILKLITQSDIICLQEIDQWEWLEPKLKEAGYEGAWWNGGTPEAPSKRHGYAIIWRTDLFVAATRMEQYSDSTQIYVVAVLAHLPSKKMIKVITTHLKAKKPFATVRVEQVSQLLKDNRGSNMATIIAGDFNATKDEVAIQMIAKQYKNAHPNIERTTIKLRSEVTSHVIDYIWYTGCTITNNSYTPTGDIPHPYLPSATHPSDHFMLTAQCKL